MKLCGLFLFCFTIIFSHEASAQIRETDEARLSMEQPELAAQRDEGNAFGSAKPGREFTYIAGPDKLWFSPDDVIMHFFTADYDEQGNITRKSRLKPGQDGIAGTDDDQLQEYHAMEYGGKGRPVRQTIFAGPGGDDEWFTGDDAVKYRAKFELDRKGNKAKEVRYDNAGAVIGYVLFSYDARKRLVKDAEYSASGPDAAWFTPDDVLLKYHLRDYAKDGRLLRAREYHLDHQGKGADNVWFTADDIVSSTKEFVWGPDKKVRKTLKAVGAGPDGEWFSGDEILQYYTLRQYAGGENDVSFSD